MSFSSEVKKELAEHLNVQDHCRRAELAALLQCGGSLCTDEDGNESIVFASENEEIVKKCFTFLGKSYNISLLPPEDFLDVRNRTEYVFEVTDQSIVKKIVKDFGFFDKDDSTMQSILKRPCCRRAYVRGLFLMNGSVNDPAKSYHLEIKVPGDKEAGQLSRIIQEFGIEPKRMLRRGQPVLYIKDGTQVGDMLTVMEATGALLRFEEQRVVRETRGIINRRVNCECANLNKTLEAAKKQVDDIRYIQETEGLESLPENLVELAKLRLEYPSASLSELGEMLHPAMGRSGVNHRLQKLMSIAEQIRLR